MLRANTIIHTYLEELLSAGPLIGVEVEAAADEVNGLAAGLREHVAQQLEVHLRQRLEHGGGVDRGDGVHVRLGGHVDHLDDTLDLVDRGRAGEHRAAVDHLACKWDRKMMGGGG